MTLILGTNSIKDTGYNVANSVRLDSASTAYLSRTVNLTQGTTSQHKFTISCWFKLGKTGQSNGEIFGAHGSSDYFAVRVQSGSRIDIISYDNAIKGRLITSPVLRDHSAWYHIVVACDSNNGSGTNRMRLYINGSEVTDFTTDTNPSSGTDLIAENMDEFNIGRSVDQVGGAGLFDGYITEFVYIDNDQLDATSFGEFDQNSPTIWKPKDVSELSQLSNTFSFYLDFEDSSNLGNDVSGNNLDFTSNNLAATDQSTDTCTNNFCTLNPLAPTADITLSEGNLKAVYGTSGTRNVQTSTFGLSSGKWYWEIKIGGSTSPNNAIVGITQLSTDTNTVLGTADNSWGYRGYDGNVFHNNADEGGSYDTFTAGDIIGIAINLDNLQGSLHKLYFSKNGTFQNGADPTNFTSTTGVLGIDDNVDYFPAIADAGSSATPQFEMNFGGTQSFTISSGNADGEGFGNFEYAPPTGFFALCTKNLAEYG